MKRRTKQKKRKTTRATPSLIERARVRTKARLPWFARAFLCFAAAFCAIILAHPAVSAAASSPRAFDGKSQEWQANPRGFLRMQQAETEFPWRESWRQRTAETQRPEDPAKPFVPVQAFPIDWHIEHWALTSGEAFTYRTAFISQSDLIADPEFNNGRLGFLLAIDQLEDVKKVFARSGLSLSIAWLSGALNQFENRPDVPWQLKYLLRVPAASEGWLSRINFSAQVTQNIGANKTEWVAFQQIAATISGPLAVVARLRYDDFDKRRRISEPEGWVSYVAAF